MSNILRILLIVVLIALIVVILTGALFFRRILQTVSVR